MKHLSTRRKRKQVSDSVSSGERKRMVAKPGLCDTRQGLQVGGCGTYQNCLPAVRRGRAAVVEVVVSATA